MAIHRLTESSLHVHVSISSGKRTADVIALIDTGASMSALHPDVIKSLDPQVIGAYDVRQIGEDGRPGEILKFPSYYLAMIFDDTPPPMGIEVVAAVPRSPCQMLIGREYLGKWLMAWDGSGDRLAISY